MRGVFGLTLIIVGVAVAWLVILGKFPPHAAIISGPPMKEPTAAATPSPLGPRPTRKGTVG